MNDKEENKTYDEQKENKAVNENESEKGNETISENENENKEEVDASDAVTREINLDELYDGAVNNTVVIDPVTNDEVLLPSKKPNYTLIGVILAIVVLLILYYVNNKTELGGTTKDVEPKTTTTTTSQANTNESKTGVLTCTYNSKSDAETQTVTFVANYENDVLTTSNFNYVVVSNLDSTSAVIEDLKNQYENLYINNASVIGNNMSYEKDNKGFTFNVETDYDVAEFDKISVTPGQTILYVKPNSTDTYETLQAAYIEKGFSCTLSAN